MGTMPYMRIAQEYRHHITEGHEGWREGDVLPELARLAEIADVSMATHRRAIQTLVTWGMLRVSGHGMHRRYTVVTQGTVPSPMMRALRAHNLDRVTTENEHSRILSAGLIAAPTDVAEILGVEPGTDILMRRRVTLSGDLPVSYSISHKLAWTTEADPRLLSTERMPDGGLRVLEQHRRMRIDRGTDLVGIALPPPGVAEALQVAKNMPVLTGSNTWLWEDDEVAEYGRWWVPGDKQMIYQYPISHG